MKPQVMRQLVCKRIWFWSKGDETALFEWLKRISAVREIEGRGDALILHVPRRITAADFRELLALFRRYRIPNQQLAVFLTKANRRWFRNEFSKGISR
jgi:hypothetical protein